MPSGIGSAEVSMAIDYYGCACMCKYALISPLESQKSLVVVFSRTGWVWARLRGRRSRPSAFDRQTAASLLVDKGRLALKEGLNSKQPYADATVVELNSQKSELILYHTTLYDTPVELISVHAWFVDMCLQGGVRVRVGVNFCLNWTTCGLK